MESVVDSLKQLAATRILVAGDVMLDRYWLGGVDRISPEAPVPIVKVHGIDDRLGGAGNVARNITALGGQCTLLGIIGDDEDASTLASMSQNCGIKTRFTVEKESKTTVKLRIVSSNQQLLRADFEDFPAHSAIMRFRESLVDEIADHDAVVLSDYGKGTLRHIEPLIETARAADVPVLIDPKGIDFQRYTGSTMITPNLNEFRAVVGDVVSDDEINDAADKLMSGHDIDQLLVTMSDKGMRLFDSNRTTPLHIEAQSKEVFDVSGAGDTVIAVMAMAIAADMAGEVGVRIANCAAAAVISKLGTAFVDQTELKEVISRHYPNGLLEDGTGELN